MSRARISYGWQEMSDWTLLFDYIDFSSTSPFYHHVPELATEAMWGFQVDNTSPTSCDLKNVTIVLQHGSLPVINPLKEAFPTDFFIQKGLASRAVFHIMSDNVTMESVLKFPRAGPWYSVAYMPTGDGEIKPSDLFTECIYRIRSWFSVKLLVYVQSLDVQEETRIQLSNNAVVIYKFFVPVQVHDLTIHLKGCSHGNVSGCSMTLNTRGQGLPGPKAQTLSTTCYESETDCVLTNFQPDVNTWNYLEIQSNVDEELSATLSFDVTECTMEMKYQPDSSCHVYPLLDRFKYNSKFKNKFVSVNSSSVEEITVSIAENQTKAVPFLLQDGQDTGGSLIVKMNLKKVTSVDANDLHVRVDVCLQRDNVPVNVDILHCVNGYHGNITDEGEGQNAFKVIVPYPQAGMWVTGLMLQCFMADTNNSFISEPCGSVTAELNMSVTTDACVEGGCSRHGRCVNFLNGQVLYTTCKCETGWRGFACSDGSDVKGDSEELRELLLLTLSNAVFIPAIILAIVRRHYVEALVYAYNMVFSALYHACDGDRSEDFTYCALPMSVLSTCDFVGSSTSIWVTLVAMSRPPFLYKALIQIMGPLGLLVGVMYRKTSVFLFLVPAGIALLLIIISWVCRCCYRHKCYPSLKRYFICLLPGLILVAGGLALFTFLQTEANYLYTHSSWHACMALSILFLLPPRETRGIYKVKERNSSALGSTYQPIRNSSNNHVI